MRKVAAFALFVVLGVGLAGIADATPKEVHALDARDSDLEVFLAVRASPQQIARVERAVRSSDLVRRYTFLDQQAAYGEFARIFVDNPELVSRTRASDLPASFRLDVVNGLAAGPLTRSLNRLSGVTEVTKPGDELRDFIVAVIGDPCAGKSEVLVVMQLGTSDSERDRAIDALGGIDAVRSVELVTSEQIFEVLEANLPDFDIDVADLPDILRVTTSNADEVTARARTVVGIAGVDRPDPAECPRT